MAATFGQFTANFRFSGALAGRAAPRDFPRAKPKFLATDVLKGRTQFLPGHNKYTNLEGRTQFLPTNNTKKEERPRWP